ncbi:RsbRD-like negative regulator of sigma factor [Pseudomonas sp. URMO17WK12:I1]|nr:RsbRD-like negative regulator of sigma factor [Pseudomonas sp. URMO17WK12:I1]
MRLSPFIDENVEPILQAWEDFARTITVPGKALDTEALRDHAWQMLQAIVNDLDTPQSKHQQLDKSLGNGPQTAAETHAVTRLMAGFTLDQMASEYRALRTSVLTLWMGRIKAGEAVEIEDLARFHEAIDQALTEFIANYSRALEASRTLFLGILGHDLRNPLGAILLGAEMLLRNTERGDKSATIAGQIHVSAERANRIVGDLLDFARSHLGMTLPVRFQTVDLVAVCKRIVSEARAGCASAFGDLLRDRRRRSRAFR